jgi:hypothetical protein
MKCVLNTWQKVIFKKIEMIREVEIARVDFYYPISFRVYSGSDNESSLATS